MRVYCGFKDKKPGYRYETDEYDIFQVICVTRGTVILSVREKDTPAGAGSVILLPVKSVFALHCDDTEYSGFGICIHDDIEPAYRGPSVVMTATREIRRLADLLEAEMLSGDVQSEFTKRHLGLALCGLTIRLAEQRGDEDPSRANASYWAERVRNRLDINLGSNRTVRQMLSGLGLSYRQLVRHFQTCTGVTPKQYHLTQRIEESKRLLAGTRLSMLSIAMDLGFPSSQHFSTRFAQTVGVAPSAYRMKEARKVRGRSR